MWALYILVWVAVGLLGGFIASNKGYSPRLGIIVGILLGPIGLIGVAIVPRTKEGRIQAEMERATRDELAEANRTRLCPDCGREVSIASPRCPRCEHHFS